MGVYVKVVVKLTGKVFDEPYLEVLKDYSIIIKEWLGRGYRFAIVCGGGNVARRYINIARGLGVNEGWLDILGIEVSRINALLINALLGDVAYNRIPRNIDEFLTAWSSGRVVTLGGLQPGQSTNAVAMLVAELVGADLVVNATDVDGIYDKDPKVHADAKLIPRISVRELRELIKAKSLAGTYELFDSLALSIAERSRIKVFFINAFKVEAFENVMKGFAVGTELTYDE